MVFSNFLSQSSAQCRPKVGGGTHSFSNTHLFSGLSAPRHCQSCWLLSSKHCQCFRNSSKQLLLMSSSTLAAHRVTFLPSFKHSVSPLPFASVLHSMKSSLYGLQRAPMKKEAESRGAEDEPTSETLGMSSGRGVVSMRTCWLNLATSG